MNETSYVNIGIVTFNRLEYTKKCIQGILDTVKIQPYKITVVDNCSTDGSIEYLTELFETNIIHNLCLMSKNVGVSKAANAAWTKEPKANFFIKLDNDMVPTKEGWLESMVEVFQTGLNLGSLGYNVETVSYPITNNVNGHDIRVKTQNIGGACLLIPKKTEQKIGYFNEEYGSYGEEDADFYIRLQCHRLANAYMEDEDLFFHLPSGKAAIIDTSQPGFVAKDGMEEIYEKEYRDFKDSFRTKNVPKLMLNYQSYAQKSKSTYIKTNAAHDFRYKWQKRSKK